MKYAFIGVVAAAGGATLAAAQAGFTPLPYDFIQPANHSCVLQEKMSSCPEQDPMTVDSCCVETHGGLILATQFWNTYTQAGQTLPNASWTLHGMWPDWCNGSYTGYCDISRQFDPSPSPNVSTGGVPLDNYSGNVTGTNVLTMFKRFDLLEWMNKYWINRDASNEDFWMHEFSKHATCYSQYQTACYGEAYVENEDIPDFFDNVIGAYKMYPTYDWLAAAGITPSNTTTYSLSAIEDVLTKATGAVPYIGCSGAAYNTTQAGNGTSDKGRTELSEVWYYNYAFGDLRSLNFTATNQTGSSSCAMADNAIHYYERDPSFVA